MRIITCISLWCCLAGSLQAQLADTITLNSLVEMAEQQALSNLQAERDLEVARLDYEVFRADLRPQLNLDANVPNYLKSFTEVVQPDGTIRFESVQNNNSGLSLELTQIIPQTGGQLFLRSNLQRFDDFESDFSLYNGRPFRFGIIQPIFAFNSFKWDRQLAPLRVEEAEANFRLNRELIREEVTQLFFDLLLAGQESRIADTNYYANERLFAIAEERYSLGKISRRDLLQLELELVSAQRGQLRAQQTVQQASAAVATYLGLAAKDQLFVAQAPAEIVDLSLTNEEAWSQALANRPEWVRFGREMMEARRDMDEARRSGAPSLQLVAASGQARSSTELMDIYQDAQAEAFLQLQISVPILDGGRRKRTMERAQVQQAFASQRIEREQLELEQIVANTLTNFQSLQQELELANRQQDLAAERFRITTESYILGASALSELTLAQREKDQATRTWAATQRAYWIAYAGLRQLTLPD
ncbi:MAG: TolC family protein [Bacteroidota bacterium]